jgi:hypothetical protein
MLRMMISPLVRVIGGILLVITKIITNKQHFGSPLFGSLFKKLRRFGALGGVVLMVGCSTTQPSSDAYTTRLYMGTYDDVWLSALKSLSDYPLKLSNKDTGRIVTEVVNGPYNELVFSYPEPLELPEKYRYSVELNFAKIEGKKGQSSVRIRAKKNLEKFHDFYTGWLAYPSDGIEEKVLLYRIEHLLNIEKHLATGTEPTE